MDRDRVSIEHMLAHAEEALALVAGASRQVLDEDRVLQLALVRLVEVVGEAASRVSGPAREQHPSVPWQVIVGMHNRLIHG